MENQLQVLINGQAVIQSDFNQIGTYGLMDDRVFAEFLRLLPYDGVNVDRAIFPYMSGPVCAPNGATGSVLVSPFRALIGSRTAVGTDALKNWRDIRSGIWVGGATSLTAAQAFSANVSGNPRWDLVYINITPDANTTPVPRKVKDPATHAITTPTTVTTLVTSVSISVQAGTPSATPAFPGAPADGGGTYKIPIAYVRIPNGFGAGSTVLTTDIVMVAPIGKMQNGVSAPGTLPSRVNNNMFTADQNSWGSTGTRPPAFLPSDLTRAAGRFVALDIPDGNTAHWTATPGNVIDIATDWRNRYFKFQMTIGSNKLASDRTAAGGVTPSAALATSASATVGGMGQSFFSDAALGSLAGSGLTGAVIAYADSTNIPAFGAGGYIVFYVDPATGFIKFATNGTIWPSRVFLWLDATTQFGNY